MKKVKLLLPILAITPIATAISLTGCNNNQEIKVTPVGGSTISFFGDAKYVDVTFTSNLTITKDETIEVKCSSEDFTCSVSKEDKDTNVFNVKIEKASEDVKESTDVKFTFKSTKGWTTDVKCTIVYNRGVWIDQLERQKSTTEYDETTGYASYTYELDILKAVPDTHFKVTPTITEKPTGAEFISCVANVVDSKLQVKTTIKCLNASEEIKFNLLVECLTENNTHAFAPINLKDFSLKYYTKTVEAPEGTITFDTSGSTPVLKFDSAKITGNVNAIRLPIGVNGNANTPYTVKENTFNNLPAQVTEIIIEDISNVTFEQNVFKGKPINKLNLSTNATFINNPEELSLGTNCFAFSTSGALGTGGSIVWNSNTTFADKHAIKEQLWKDGGLTCVDWYEYTPVRTESELKQAIWTGGNIYLENDITITSPITFEATYAILDFCGYKIQVDQSKWDTTVSSAPTHGVFNVVNAELIMLDSSQATEGAKPAMGGIFTRRADGSVFDPGCPAIYSVWSNIEGIRKTSVSIYGGHFEGHDSAIYNYSGDVYIKNSTKADGTELYCPEFQIANWTSTASAQDLLTCYSAFSSRTSNYYISGGDFISATKIDETPASPDPKAYNPAACREHSQQTSKTKSWLVNGYTSVYKDGQIYKYYKVNKV